MAEVKHITMICPEVGCSSKAFVQVLAVNDKQLQSKIDARANRKLKAALKKAHKQGKHES